MSGRYFTLAEYCYHTISHVFKANCNHNWSSDGQRYMYGIRHLYGREGRMVDYQPHSCQTLQKQVLSTKQEGGCPFRYSITKFKDTIHSIRNFVYL